VAGGWYFGLGGGASVPSGDFGDAFSTGWNAGALLGWRPANGIVGVRLDANYNRMSAQDSPLLSSSDQATIWSGMLDLTLDFPLGQNGSSFYLLGGGGVHNMTMDIEGIDEDIDLDATKLGVNAGAGLSFAMGRTNLFVEGRFVNVFSGDDGDDNPFNDDDRRYIPIMAGLKWHF
jgi:opacity protein-like surface antigen